VIVLSGLIHEYYRGVVRVVGVSDPQRGWFPKAMAKPIFYILDYRHSQKTVPYCMPVGSTTNHDSNLCGASHDRHCLHLGVSGVWKAADEKSAALADHWKDEKPESTLTGPAAASTLPLRTILHR